MKLWIDDVREAPEGYSWVKTVNAAKQFIEWFESEVKACETYGINNLWYQSVLIDIDHDAGEYVDKGGDYIKFLDWLEETGRNYPIRIHSMNPVGVENMRRIIQRNGWTEVK